MSKSYLTDAARGTVETPQSEPMRDDQVENSAGGFAWAVDEFTRLRRFLILGSEGGSYYASERDLTKENVKVLDACLAADGVRTVEEIVAISDAGRAPKNDPAIFALAYAVAHGTNNTKRVALANLHRVCRIGTHLFTFVGFLDTMSGWGRAKRRALAEWYVRPRLIADEGTVPNGDAAQSRHLKWLASQIVKYRSRNGWSHRDVLRLAHPAQSVSAGNPTTRIDGPTAALLAYAAGKPAPIAGLPSIIEGFEAAQKSPGTSTTAALVREYGLPREALLTEHLGAPEVWDALLDAGMGITALIRNLANMTRIGLLTPTSEATVKVLARLRDGEAIQKGRVHPLNILFALKTYESGRGFRGSNAWAPVPQIVDALNDAFYAAFGNVAPTGKRLLLGLDVSGSMGSPIGDTSLSCRDGAAAMALVTAAVEDRYECVAFTSSGWSPAGYSGNRYYGGGVDPFPISGKQRLDDVVRNMERLDFGGTDCALPMLYAIENEREVDTFIVYTDNETWHGSIHPAQALARYRKESGIADARLIVVGMVSNGFSIADPNDPGMLDVVGFDTATPSIITEFTRGTI